MTDEGAASTRSVPRISAAIRAAEAERTAPEALVRNRFERDRRQALAVIVMVAFPIAAFGVIDVMVAKSVVRLAILWSIRAATLLGLSVLWRSVRRAATRAHFERLLFRAQMIGVLLAVAAHMGRGPQPLFMTRFELLSVVIYYLMIPGRTRRQAIPAMSLSVASLAMLLFWHVDVDGPDLVSNVVCFILANALGVLVGRLREAAEDEEETAWRALTSVNANLRKTLQELRMLRSVVPVCPACRKVRGNNDSWQQLEAYVAERNDIEFSPILCPDCLTKQFGAVLSEGSVPG